MAKNSVKAKAASSNVEGGEQPSMGRYRVLEAGVNIDGKAREVGEELDLPVIEAEGHQSRGVCLTRLDDNDGNAEA